VTDDLEWWTELLGKPNRVMAPIRYYGGKGRLARRIVRLLPPGKIYVEPYCGAASVFWHLPQPYEVEVLNDLDERVVNLFRVLQDPEQFAEFAHRVYWTPYSHSEFVRALRLLDSADSVEAAWALYVVCNQGMGSVAHRASAGNWGRVLSYVADGMAGTCSGWRKRMGLLRAWHERLTRVQIDCRDALEVIRYWDSPQTVFYIDPPYPAATRRDARKYLHEASDEHHRALVDLLLTLRGSAVVSSHDHEIYRSLEEAGWERYEIRTATHAAGRTRGSGLQGPGAALRKVPRTEVLWRRVQEGG